MNHEYILFAILGVAILIFFLAFYFSDEAIIKRKLRNAQKSPIALCKENELVKIVGKVETIETPLVAPLSKRNCAYYHVEVEKKVSSGKNSYWKKIIDEEKKIKFILREGKDVVIVHMDHVASFVTKDAEYRSGFLNDATKNLETYLRKHGHDPTGFLGFNTTLQYKEGILEEKESVAVIGRCYWSDGKTEGLPEDYKKVLVIAGTAKEPVYLSDAPETLG